MIQIEGRRKSQEWGKWMREKNEWNEDRGREGEKRVEKLLPTSGNNVESIIDGEEKIFWLDINIQRR